MASGKQVDEISDRRNADVLKSGDVLLPDALDGRDAVGHFQRSPGNPAAGLRLTGRLRGSTPVASQMLADMLNGAVGPLGTLGWSQGAVRGDIVEHLAKLWRRAFQERVQPPDHCAVVKALVPLLAQYVVQRPGGAF